MKQFLGKILAHSLIFAGLLPFELRVAFLLEVPGVLKVLSK